MGVLKRLWIVLSGLWATLLLSLWIGNDAKDANVLILLAVLPFIALPVLTLLIRFVRTGGLAPPREG